MDRRTFIRTAGAAGSLCALPIPTNANFPPFWSSPGFFHSAGDTKLTASAFGTDFLWGVSTAAFQIEGAFDSDGKSSSVWDTFSHRRGKIKTKENADIACDFYHRYPEDIDLVHQLGFNAFRFSLAWTRIIPGGYGSSNTKGIDYYHRIIDKCLEKGIQPWVTLYHWDLPQALEDKGGWTNRDIISWFGEYVNLCTSQFGDKVSNWMVLNEPLAFTALGYLLGIHAPGKRGLGKFLCAVHHTALSQAEGGRIAKRNVPRGQVGTTFSCSAIEPHTNSEKDQKTAERFDAFINRLFVEPAAGLGYPIASLPFLKRIEKYMLPGDENKLKFDFDFIGMQNYTREIAKHSSLIPFMKGKQVAAKKRGVEVTEMGWEVYPKGIYTVLKQFSVYKNFKKMYITENGAAFPDTPLNGKVNDERRVRYFDGYLREVLSAKKEGVNVQGYFVWSLMDNFEWAEGYRPRFGLVYVDFKTQERIIKDSGWWFKELLNPHH